MEPPGPHPTRKLTVENERLRLRIEALERLAADSRQAEEARRDDEERRHRGAQERRRHEAEVLGRITGEINASLNHDTVLARVAEGGRDYAEVAERETINALMAVPILLGSDVEGIIYVGNQTTQTFAEGDETSVQRLADHAGLAIQNAQFRGHVRRQEELAALYEVARVVTGLLPDGALVSALQALLGRLVDARQLLALT